MKREEAIQTLNVMQSSYAHIRHSDAEWEALEMAKEALNSQRMEPCMKCSSKCCFCLFNESRKCIRCKDHSFYTPVFNFCPHCGYPLVKENHVELEKRMGLA